MVVLSTYYISGLFLLSVYSLPIKTSRTYFQQTGKYYGCCYVLISIDHTSSINTIVCNLAMFSPHINTLFSHKILCRWEKRCDQRKYVPKQPSATSTMDLLTEVLYGTDETLAISSIVLRSVPLTG